MATKAKFGTKKALKDAKASSRMATAGGSAAAGTHTAKLVQKAIKRLTGKVMKPVKTAEASLRPLTGKVARLKNNNPERFARLEGERLSRAEVSEMIRRDARASNLLKARAAKRGQTNKVELTPREIQALKKRVNAAKRQFLKR